MRKPKHPPTAVVILSGYHADIANPLQWGQWLHHVIVEREKRKPSLKYAGTDPIAALFSAQKLAKKHGCPLVNEIRDRPSA